MNEAQERIINAVERKLAEALDPFGFVEEPSARTIEGQRFIYWDRDLRWKRDRIRLNYRLRSASSLMVSLEVLLSCGPQGELLLDGRTVHGLVGRSGSYWLPNFLGKVLEFRDRAFAEKVAQDTLRALRWFEEYDSPEKCRQKLEAGETNHGFARGTAYQELSSCLQTLNDTLPG